MHSTAYRFMKRTGDILISSVALLLLSPVFAAISLWIKADSQGPVFFRQKRVGRNKTHFMIVKFRTMYTSAPKDMPTHLVQNSGSMITKAGRILRKTSLDELPQLWNILKGEMSLVGPRPALYNQYDLIAERDKYKANDVRPGLTGLAQISGRDELEIATKARRDGEYIASMSALTDISILLRTFLSVLRHEGVRDNA
ncbi:MAG: sugar transferase [Clostridia bacterium]|nr:sugar transferase [Clostridia bacterium]MBQ4085080.1 sugar transferase [Clostridia bacterium]